MWYVQKFVYRDSEPRLGGMHEIFFHGCEVFGADLDARVAILRNLYHVPDVAIIERLLILTKRLADGLGFPPGRFRPVETEREYWYPHALGDFSYREDSANTYEAKYFQQVAARFAKKYERPRSCPPLVHLITPESEDVQAACGDVGTYVVPGVPLTNRDEELELSLSPSAVERHGALRCRGFAVSDAVFAKLDDRLDRNYFYCHRLSR